MFDILIVSKGGGALRLIRNRTSGKVTKTEYEEVASGATRVNALKGVVCTLEQIYDTRDKISGVVNIYTVGLVADVVQRGTFKYWLLEGKTSNGQELNPVELELWKKFVELYTKMYGFINIKNISSASVPRNPKFHVSREQQALARLASIAWDECPEPAVESDVADLEEIPF